MEQGSSVVVGRTAEGRNRRAGARGAGETLGSGSGEASEHTRLKLVAKEIGGGRACPGEAGLPGTGDRQHARLKLAAKEIGGGRSRRGESWRLKGGGGPRGAGRRPARTGSR